MTASPYALSIPAGEVSSPKPPHSESRPLSWLCAASRRDRGVRVLSLPGSWKLAPGHLARWPSVLQLLLLISS